MVALDLNETVKRFIMKFGYFYDKDEEVLIDHFVDKYGKVCEDVPWLAYSATVFLEREESLKLLPQLGVVIGVEDVQLIEDEGVRVPAFPLDLAKDQQVVIKEDKIVEKEDKAYVKMMEELFFAWNESLWERMDKDRMSFDEYMKIIDTDLIGALKKSYWCFRFVV